MNQESIDYTEVCPFKVSPKTRKKLKEKYGIRLFFYSWDKTSKTVEISWPTLSDEQMKELSKDASDVYNFLTYANKSGYQDISEEDFINSKEH